MTPSQTKREVLNEKRARPPKGKANFLFSCSTKPAKKVEVDATGGLAAAAAAAAAKRAAVTQSVHSGSLCSIDFANRNSRPP